MLRHWLFPIISRFLHINGSHMKVAEGMREQISGALHNLTFPNRTHKLDQTKITINGFGMAKRAAQLLYVPLPVVSSVSVDLGTKTQMDFLMNLWFLYL